MLKALEREPRKLLVALGSVAHPPLIVRKSQDPSKLVLQGEGVRVRRLADGLSVTRNRRHSALPQLEMHAPERFCEMDVRCRSDAHVDCVKEAPLRLHSANGSASVASASCEYAALSAAHTVSVRKLSGLAHLRSSHGNVHLQRYTGSFLNVFAPLGAYHSEATFASDGSIDVGGSEGINISELRVDGNVNLVCSANGAPINIGSVNGKGTLIVVTSNGNISMQVASLSLNIAVHTHNGNAEVRTGVPMLAFLRSRGHEQSLALAYTGQGEQASEDAAQLSIDSGSGEAQVCEQTWAQMMERKLKTRSR